jgi:hypothetical protein
MTPYDPELIQKFADRLYQQANSALISAVVIGILVGGGLGAGAGFGSDDPTWAIIGAVIGAVILGLLGYWAGRERAFQLKLQAQIALCQLKIEENTRK